MDWTTPEGRAELAKRERDMPYRLAGGAGEYYFAAHEVEWVNAARGAIPQLLAKIAELEELLRTPR